jgi:pimeloyl-ACP methyl ester carboxylesterase
MFVREYAQREAEGTRSIVWVHGLGESGLSFVSIGPILAAPDRRQLMPDLPGYGRSGWREQPLSLSGAADLLAEWIESRRASPACVVGHSMGGVIALLLAERHPAAVRAIVDVEGNKSGNDCAFSRPAAVVAPTEFEEGGLDRLRARVLESADGDPALAGYATSLRLADPRQFHAHAAELVRLSESERLAGRLGALECPTLFVAGMPRGVCRRSLDLLGAAGVRVEELRPAGHWPFLDMPRRFADIVSSFLDGIG